MTVGGDVVLDASCALSLALQESCHTAARSLVDRAVESGHRCFVPDLFDAECAAGIAKAVRRGRLREDMWAEAWAGIASLQLERRSSRLLGHAAVRIALEHGVSTYDALYIALSAEEDAPLVTADAKLARALRGSTYDVRLLEDVALS